MSPRLTPASAALLVGALVFVLPAGAQIESSTPFRVHGQTVGDQFLAAGPAARDGRFLVVWAAPDAEGTGLFGRIFGSDGTPFGDETQINVTEAQWQSVGHIVPDPSGGFLVAWKTSDFPIAGTATGLYSRRVSATGAPLGDEVLIPTPRPATTDILGGVAEPAGGFLLVVASFDPVSPDHRSLLIQRLDREGRLAGEAAPLASVPRGALPSFTSLPEAGFTLAWIDDSGPRAQIFGSGGRSLGPPFPLDMGDSPYAEETFESSLTVTATSEGSLLFGIRRDITTARTPGFPFGGEPAGFSTFTVRAFSRQGSPLGPPAQVARAPFSPGGPFSLGYRLAAGLDPGALLLYHNSERGLVARLLDERGIPQGRERVLTPSPVQSFAAAANRAGEWVVAATAEDRDGTGVFGAVVSTTGEPLAPCRPDSQTLCLNGGRFEVRVEYRAHPSRHPAARGQARGVRLHDDSAYFWFFDPANVELGLKILDGRRVNGHFWLFYGALSSVYYWIDVLDTESGRARISANPAGRLASLGNVTAFPAEDPPGAATGLPAELSGQPLPATPPSGPCGSPGPVLCLHQGRFEVRVTWRDFQGNEGAGHARPLTSDSGWFWFFRPDNLELLLKVIDGRPVNGHWWVFFGSLTNVAFDVTVTDTVEGQTRTYRNPAGQFASRADIRAF